MSDAHIGTFTPDNLLAGDYPRVTGWLGISSALKRGTIVTSAGAKMASGGEPYAIVAEDAETQAPVFLSGEFNINTLNEVNGITLTDADIAKLRAINIYAKPALKAA